MKKIVTVVLALALILSVAPKVEAAKLSKKQQKRIETIYKVTANEKNYKKYKILPSVCMAFSVVESGIGLACRKNNLWGLGAGHSSYSTLEKGVYAYMKCINNGYYKGATKTKKWLTQTKRIIAGGYCQPAGAYVSKVKNVMKRYGFDKYDKKMFKAIKKAEKKRKAEKARKKKILEEKKKREEEKRRKQEIANQQKALIQTVIPFPIQWIGTFDELNPAN